MRYVMTDRWLEDSKQAQCEMPDGRWAPARPVRADSLRERLADAWLVLRGRADVILWAQDVEEKLR